MKPPSSEFINNAYLPTYCTQNKMISYLKISLLKPLLSGQLWPVSVPLYTQVYPSSNPLRCEDLLELVTNYVGLVFNPIITTLQPLHHSTFPYIIHVYSCQSFNPLCPPCLGNFLLHSQYTAVPLYS
jgi:hypothetical protein